MQTLKLGDDSTVEVHVDVAAVKRCRDLVGLNITTPDDLESLCRDPVAQIDALFAICYPQVEKRELTDNQFGELVLGVLPDAGDVLIEQIACFFDRCGNVQATTATFLRKTWQGQTKLADRLATLAATKGDAAINQAVDQAADAIERHLDEMAKPPPTSSRRVTDSAV